MEIFIYVTDMDSFLDKLCSFLQGLTNDYQVRYNKDHMVILYKYFYIDVIRNEDLDMSCIVEDYNVNVNFELWTHVYSKTLPTYPEGLRDMVKMINWINKNIESDIVLLDETSYPVFSFVRKVLYCDKSIPYFPYEELELS